MQLSFVSNFVVEDKMCICDSTAITCGKVMFYRDKCIHEYNTYKYIKCLLYRYALNVCTESWRAHRSEQNDRGVSVLSRYMRKEVSKKKNLCQNNVWTTNVFESWLYDGRVLFCIHFRIIVFFLYKYIFVNVLTWDSTGVSFVSTSLDICCFVFFFWRHRQTEPDG